ncbi:hypothetical protein ACFV84_23545, partial [Kitasatospora sp. NPDC059811]
ARGRGEVCPPAPRIPPLGGGAPLLGRSGFGVTAAGPRLAAAGLLDAPRYAAPAAAPAVAPSAATPVAPVTPVAPGAPRPAAPVAEAEAPAPEAPAPARPPGGGLHRRVPGATLTGATPSGPVAPARSDRPPTTAAAHPPLAVPDPDIALLTRVRTLLEARL